MEQYLSLFYRLSFLTVAIAFAYAIYLFLWVKRQPVTNRKIKEVAALIREGTVYLLHVGDSRCYLIHEKGVRQMTRDHSMVQLLVDRGEITPEEAKYHPERHFITRALGVGENLEADYLEESVPAGGWVLLCSDGLSNHLDEEDIGSIISGHTPAEGMKELVDRANVMGGTDNITAVLIENRGR